MTAAVLREERGLRHHSDVAVKPWSYNPSAWRQRIPICLLAWVAFLIATHLALYQWRIIGSVWDPVFGEQSARVLDSDVAAKMHGWFGIPDAALGALAYLGDAIFGLAGCTRFLCIVTAVISLLLVYLAYDEVYSSLKYLYAIWKQTRSGRLVWAALWGRPSAEARAVGNEMVAAV
jgi:hypothetical protein